MMVVIYTMAIWVMTYLFSKGYNTTDNCLVANRDLQIFTSTSELYIPSFADKALTPTNAQIRRQTPYGASYVRPLPFDGATIYIQKTGTSVREFLFSEQ